MLWRRLLPAEWLSPVDLRLRGTLSAMSEVLHVHGDPGKFRTRLRARIGRGEEIDAQLLSYEQRRGAVEPFAGTPGSLAEAFYDLEWSSERSDLVKRIRQWDGTNLKQLKQSLGTAAASCYGIASVPEVHSRSDVSAIRSFLQIRMEELREVERRLPARRPTVARPVDIYSLDDLRASGLFDVDVLDEFEDRLADMSNARKWRSSIAAAKELVEAVHQAVFHCLGEEPPPRSTDFVKLGKLARRAMLEEANQQGLSDVAKVDGNQQLDRALAGLLQALAEIRNAYGGGHGRPRRDPGLQLRHVQLAVESCIAYSRYVIATLNDLGRLPKA